MEVPMAAASPEVHGRFHGSFHGVFHGSEYLRFPLLPLELASLPWDFNMNRQHLPCATEAFVEAMEASVGAMESLHFLLNCKLPRTQTQESSVETSNTTSGRGRNKDRLSLARAPMLSRLTTPYYVQLVPLPLTC